MSEAVLENLPKFRGLQLTALDKGFRLRRSRRQGGLAAFFSFWLTGWTVGCVFLLQEFLKEPQLFLFLFGLPFWSAWVFVVFLWANCLWSWEEWRLTEEGLVSSRRWGFVKKRHEVRLEDLRKFQVSASETKNRFDTTAVEAHCRDQVLTFGEGLDRQELRLVAEMLEHSRQQFYKEAGIKELEGIESAPSDTPLSRSEETASARSLNWSAETEFDSVIIRHRSSGHLAAIGGALFICLFWNGIVSVFVGLLFGFVPDDQPQGMEWWFLFLFLLPFELIGLILIWVFLTTLAAPFRRETWQFGRQEIAHRVNWFGLGRTRTYEAPRRARVESFHVGPSAAAKGSQVDEDEKPYVPQAMKPEYQVQLVGSDDVEVCSLSSLTKFEADWLVNLLHKERPEYFR